MVAIRAVSLGKCYRISRSPSARYGTLRDSLSQWARRPLRPLWRNSIDSGETNFWALQDVSFEIPPGEVVGIIGRNGAGKSTLLKILSRVTKPTTGSVELNGRVGSLLEVGTGFHQELSGRENIYLNGSILGMSRREIARNFDEIVAFAGVEDFLETPVKRYSSGMYVRLAFAVAAHLEPEIMLVDEVLAVGDADFQMKCFAKMEQVAHSGRTVFLVSHQLSAVRRLCRQAIFLEKGRLKLFGDQNDVIDRYLTESTTVAVSNRWIHFDDRPRPGTTGQARIKAVMYSGADGRLVEPDGELAITVQIESTIPQSASRFALTISDRFGTKLVNADIASQSLLLPLRAGLNTVAFSIRELHLSPGVYNAGLRLANSEDVFDNLPDSFQIEVSSEVEKADALFSSRGCVTSEFNVATL